jgi:hypothetical protein
VISASGDAQRLALLAKHFKLDPYEIWNKGIEPTEVRLNERNEEVEVAMPLPPHPRPRQYRHLLYAMAEWLEDQEFERWKGIIESNGASLKGLR